MEGDSRDLVQQASQHDAGALEQLMVRHLPGLRAFVRLRMGERLRAKESCSDLVQSVCREALGDLEHFEYRDEASFKQWLYTRALNKIQNRVRFHAGKKRDPALEVPIAGTSQDDGLLLDTYRAFCTPSRDAMAAEEIRRIEGALLKLPETWREVIVQARIIGLAHKEIAERMGKSEGAVRVLLHRALARLSGVMGDEAEGPPGKDPEPPPGRPPEDVRPA